MGQSDTKCPVAIVWEEILSGSFSVIGRLGRLAECRDAASGRYRHPKIAELLGVEGSHDALTLAHNLAWRDWINGSFLSQQTDLALHLQSLPGGIDVIVPIWRDTQPFLKYIPVGATEAERNLYTQNVNTLLKLFSCFQDASQQSNSSSSFRPIAIAGDSLPKKALRIVNEMYSDSRLSLQTISKALHVSDDHLGRVLRSHTGQTFRECLRSVRIREAARLLRSSDLGVKTIAAMVGYNDPSHFVRYFHAELGSTPTKFRKLENSPGLPDLAMPKPDLA